MIFSNLRYISSPYSRVSVVCASEYFLSTVVKIVNESVILDPIDDNKYTDGMCLELDIVKKKKESKGQMHSPRSCSSEMFEIKMDATKKCSHLSLNKMDVACVDNDADNVKEVMGLLIGLVSGPQNYPGLALCWGRLWKRRRMENESHPLPQPNTLTKKWPGIGNIQEIHLVKPLWTYIVHIHQAISFSSKRGAKKLRLAVCYPWLKEQQNGVWTVGRNRARSLIPLKSLI